MTILVFMMCVTDALAQRRGGAVRGGVRGAMVGGMVAGESGAKTGAKVGVVTGATRGVVQRADYQDDQRTAISQEAESRAQYATTAEYKNADHADFNQAPPEVIVTSAEKESPAKGEESVISQNGQSLVAITYPADWKLKKGEHALTAVSADGQAWSAVSILPNAQDKQAALEKIKGELSKYLENIEFDEPTKTERGALIITGTGKSKKAGADVVFATGVFDATPKQLAGAAFVVDKNVEDHYKETVRCICQTIRTANEVSKPSAPTK